MSTATPNDDGQHPEGAAPPEAEAQELFERLRSAPAAEIISDLFSTLLSAAQVKLGRRDARLFIDLCAEALQYSRPHLPDDLVSEVERALGQLRLAQVSAENEAGKKEAPEANDLSRMPTPPAGAKPAKAGSTQQSAAPASKLWVPGR